MEPSAKRLWIATTANAVVSILVVLVLYAMLAALGAFAAEVTAWPLLVLLIIGLPLSVAGQIFSRGVASRVARVAALLVNGCALALYVLIIAGVVALFASGKKERFLIPQGYQGDVYIIYRIPDGQPDETTQSEVTYRIPEDGVLRTRGEMIREFTRPEYYYVLKDGRLKRITSVWNTTIQRTPENLSDHKDIGVYSPGSGTFSDASGCSIQYERFYVGTKAQLLTAHKEKDLGRYLRDHPGTCSEKTKQ